MKAQITSDVIGIISIIALLFIILVLLLPRMIMGLISEMSLFSAQNVARQLSSLIDVSTVTFISEIEFFTRENLNYDVSLSKQFLTIRLASAPAYWEKTTGKDVVIFMLNDYEKKEVNYFVIKKTTEIGKGVEYEFYAEKK